MRFGRKLFNTQDLSVSEQELIRNAVSTLLSLLRTVVIGLGFMLLGIWLVDSFPGTIWQWLGYPTAVSGLYYWRTWTNEAADHSKVDNSGVTGSAASGNRAG